MSTSNILESQYGYIYIHRCNTTEDDNTYHWDLESSEFPNSGRMPKKLHLSGTCPDARRVVLGRMHRLGHQPTGIQIGILLRSRKDVRLRSGPFRSG